MNLTNIVDALIKDIKERLTFDGKNRVFEEGKELSSEFMIEKVEPEAFTRGFLIDKIFDALGLEKLPERFEEEGLKTNFLRVVGSYLKNIAGLEAGEEKLRVVKEVVRGV